MQPKRVQELMWSQHAAVVSLSLTVREAAERLIVSDTDLLAVRDSQGRLAGIVMESAVVRCLLATPPAGATIEPLLIRHVDFVRHDDTVSSVLHLFRSACHTAVPVVDQHQRVCGLLLRRDIMAEMLNTAGRVAPAVVPPAAVPAPAQSSPGSQPAARQEPTADAPWPRTSLSARIDRGEEAVRPPDPAGAATTSRDSATSRDSDGSGRGPGEGTHQRPHFLTGEEARRRLSGADQIQGGICDPPW